MELLSHILSGERNKTIRALCTSIGLGLLGEGIRRRGAAGTVEILLGAALTYEGMSPYGFVSLFRCDRRDGAKESPSYVNHETAPPATQMPMDEVDEALMESFPASDPPAYGKAMQG